MKLGIPRIREVLKADEGSMRDIALSCGVTDTMVSHVLAGRRKSARILQAARTKAQELLSNCGKKGKVSA